MANGDEFVPVEKVPTTENQEFQPAAKIRRTSMGHLVENSPYLKLFDMIGQPFFEGMGLVGGGIIGTGLGPFGTVAGAALGYGMGKKTGEIVRRQMLPTGEKPAALSIGEEIARSAEDIKSGAEMEMLGQSAGKALQYGAKQLGKAALQGFGKLTGTGSGAAEQAVKSGQANIGKNPFVSRTAFDKALRGKMEAEEVVDLARSALTRIKDARATSYQSQLKNIQRLSSGTNFQINPKPITDKLTKLADQYRIGITRGPNGEYLVDTSRAALGKTGRNDIKDVITEIGGWDDFTPAGLDALKRRVADFYSDSSQARQFVTSLGKTIRDTIVDAVPEYAKMTKDYEMATKLIKDIESNLMMRKQGMSGRIVSDQTLRRLISAMKDNFALRKDLVEALSAQGDEDVMGAVSGFAMSQFMPRGITGTGAAIIGSLYAAAINPKFWPLVLSSSPRIAGEFLRLYGKYATSLGVTQTIGRTAGYGLVKERENQEMQPNE